MMLSQGKVDIDDVLQLRDGKLTMYLEKETYERAGIVGKPNGAKGKRANKPRWSKLSYPSSAFLGHC